MRLRPGLCGSEAVLTSPTRAGYTTALVERLRRGGATDLHATSAPTWIIGRAPSGHRFQILWNPHREAYCVSRRTDDGELVAALGNSPDWRTTVTCALEA